MPSYTTRSGSTGGVAYRGTSLHATRLLYIALTYLADHDKARGPYTSGVCLFDANNTIEVQGPTGMSTKALFDHLYSRGGWLYVLPAGLFTHWKGLGPLEVASKAPVAPTERIHLTVTELRALLQVLGTVVVHRPAQGVLL